MDKGKAWHFNVLVGSEGMVWREVYIEKMGGDSTYGLNTWIHERVEKAG